MIFRFLNDNSRPRVTHMSVTSTGLTKIRTGKMHRSSLRVNENGRVVLRGPLSKDLHGSEKVIQIYRLPDGIEVPLLVLGPAVPVSRFLLWV